MAMWGAGEDEDDQPGVAEGCKAAGDVPRRYMHVGIRGPSPECKPAECAVNGH